MLLPLHQDSLLSKNLVHRSLLSSLLAGFMGHSVVSTTFGPRRRHLSSGAAIRENEGTILTLVVTIRFEGPNQCMGDDLSAGLCHVRSPALEAMYLYPNLHFTKPPSNLAIMILWSFEFVQTL